jgi:hypothetical protein
MSIRGAADLKVPGGNPCPDGTALAVAHCTSTNITEFVCSVSAKNAPAASFALDSSKSGSGGI